MRIVIVYLVNKAIPENGRLSPRHISAGGGGSSSRQPGPPPYANDGYLVGRDGEDADSAGQSPSSLRYRETEEKAEEESTLPPLPTHPTRTPAEGQICAVGTCPVRVFPGFKTEGE